MARPNWEAVWMDVAKAVSARSLCSRSTVGAVIVTSDNRVECASYNGPPPAFPHGGKPCTEWCPRSQRAAQQSSTNPPPLDIHYDDCPAGHAESNAIARSDWSRLQNATIYSTSSVCMGCAKMIAQTGITRVIHIVDPAHTHRSTGEVERFLLRNGIHVVQLKS